MGITRTRLFGAIRKSRVAGRPITQMKTRTRALIALTTIAVVISLGTLSGLYARGYRFNSQDLKFSANGLLSIKSVPDGAQIIINGNLKTATDATIPLEPGTYDVQVKKEGFTTWNKRLVIEKEVVTVTTAYLFKRTPSISAITFSGVSGPVATKNLTKIAYVVPSSSDSTQSDNSGLWVIETVDLPIGFARDPRRITDGDLSDSSVIWSPDEREILLTTSNGSFLLNAGQFTPQNQRVNITSFGKQELLSQWEDAQKKKLDGQLKRLPNGIKDVLERKAKYITPSPDKDMIMYTASGDANIPEGLIPALPGSSTQRQERDIKSGRTYIYDIKEDRNFLIDNGDSRTIIGAHNNDGEGEKRLTWFPTSRHVVIADSGSVVIMDYDGTNKQEVYSGSYVSPHAFPTLSRDRLLLLTNLGADENLPDLYSLSLN